MRELVLKLPKNDEDLNSVDECSTFFQPSDHCDAGCDVRAEVAAENSKQFLSCQNWGPAPGGRSGALPIKLECLHKRAVAPFGALVSGELHAPPLMTLALTVLLLLLLSMTCTARSAQVPMASSADAARARSSFSSDVNLEPDAGADASPNAAITASASSAQAAAAAVAADADPSYDLIGDAAESLVGRYRGKRVVVVGAGAAGIAAARWLTDRQVFVLLRAW
jgi:hypothetical protein